MKNKTKENILKLPENKTGWLKVIDTDRFIFFFCLILGALFFIHYFGVLILNVKYDDWELSAWYDISIGRAFTYMMQHWHTGSFLNTFSGVYFPEDMSFSSIPISILGIIGKFKFTPPFQINGILILVFYCLQGSMGGLILKKLTKDVLFSAIGSIFFLMSASMLFRVNYHTGLAAHYIVLILIYAMVTKKESRGFKKTTLIWCAIMYLSDTSFVYFIPMTCFFMAADLIDDYIKTKKIVLSFLPGVIAFVFEIILQGLQGTFANFGNSSSGKNALENAAAFGLGYYNTNLNSLFNPMGVSKFLKDLPTATNGQYEGYAYIGFGIILGLVILLPFLVSKAFRYKEVFADKNKRVKYILAFIVALACLVFALSPTVTLNDKTLFTYDIPGFIEKLWNPFRSSGRMIWAVIYMAVTFVLWRIKKDLPAKVSVIVLAVLLIFQFQDLNGFFKSKGDPLKQRITWQSQFKSPEWERLAAESQHIIFLDQLPNNWDLYSQLLAYLYLGKDHKLTINDNYIPRKDMNKFETIKLQEKNIIASGNPRPDTIYVFDNVEGAAPFLPYLNIYTMDGGVIGLKEPRDYLAPYRVTASN